MPEQKDEPVPSPGERDAVIGDLVLTAIIIGIVVTVFLVGLAVS